MLINTSLNFCKCTIESILTGCITSWFTNSNAREQRGLHIVVDAVWSIRGADLSPIKVIYRHCLVKAGISSKMHTNRAASYHFTPTIGKKVFENENQDYQFQE